MSVRLSAEVDCQETLYALRLAEVCRWIARLPRYERLCSIAIAFSMPSGLGAPTMSRTTTSVLTERTAVFVWAWHLEMIRPAREHRVHGEHGGCGLGEGGDVCRALAQRRRADRVQFRSSGSRLGAAFEVGLVDLSRQAASGGGATPRPGCSTASASA